MEIEFGYVREYDTQRGFGFVSRTFKNDYRRKKGIWFHITKVKRNYPELARELDAGSSEKVGFWYGIDNSEGEKVSSIWLDANDIPVQQRNELIDYSVQLWRNIDNSAPQWLDQVTLALVGQLRRDELNKERKDRIRERKEAEEQEQKKKEKILLLQPLKFQTIRQNDSILGRRNTGTYIDHKEPERVYIGLPEHLTQVVLWVDRKYRTNRLSHIPGGSDVVVEYHDGHGFGYDWIKMPSVYIKTFFAGIVEYGDSEEFQKLNEKIQLQIAQSKIARLFARKYSNEDEYSIAAFSEVWNSETSNELPWRSLQKFEHR